MTNHSFLYIIKKNRCDIFSYICSYVRVMD